MSEKIKVDMVNEFIMKYSHHINNLTKSFSEVDILLLKMKEVLEKISGLEEVLSELSDNNEDVTTCYNQLKLIVTSTTDSLITVLDYSKLTLSSIYEFNDNFASTEIEEYKKVYYSYIYILDNGIIKINEAIRVINA